MKQLHLTGMFLLFLYATATAQVGINTSGALPDPSAGLDVNFTNKGFLPPRVALTATNSYVPFDSPATGIFVYNTATSGGAPYNVMPGYYCWNGWIWVAVSVPRGTNPGDMLVWNGLQWEGIPAGTNGQVLTYNNGVPTWVQPTTPCGFSMTINHLAAGGVAPVDKLVSYGTVNNIPGELPAKCWITSNLGASHQATSVDDPDEVSAGWYWQFNLKQGYKNTGTILTPAWTITIINQNSNWIPGYDPCKLELGDGWRIPTKSEWLNVDAAGGGWTNWDGPWNSDLKLHAAGYLAYTDGTLHSRGLTAVYWSSTQSGNLEGWNLGFWSGGSSVYTTTKSNGFPIRCVRD